MVTLAPLAILIGSIASAALLFYTFWGSIEYRSLRVVKNLSSSIDRAGIRRKPEEWVFHWAAATAILWMIVVFMIRPGVVFGLLLLPVLGALCAAGFMVALRVFLRRRLDRFTQQLELALRLMGAALRVGLGLRQAVAMAVEEMPEPSKSEYMRILGQTNIGVSIYDALDDMAERMPSNETRMMARVMRIQSQTGGDLSRILEQVANTIKERRRMRRKVSTLTSEGRAGAAVLLGIPIFLGTFLCATQAQMRHDILFTTAGHITLAMVAVLELCGWVTLKRILKVNFL